MEEDDDGYFEALAEAAAHTESMFISEESMIWQDLARQVAVSTNESQLSNFSIPGLFLLSKESSASIVIVEQWLHSFLPQSAWFYNLLISSMSATPTARLDQESQKLFFVDNKAHPSFLAVIQYSSIDQTVEVSFFSPYNNKQFPHIQEFAKRVFLFIRRQYNLVTARISATDIQLYSAIFNPEYYEQTYYNVCYGYSLQSPTDLAKSAVLPTDYTICNLSAEDAAIIDEHWKFRYPNSIRLVEQLIATGLGRGIRYRNREKNCSELAAWCLVYNEGAMGMLYTMENHRGKKLGTIVGHAVASGILEILSNITLSRQIYGDQVLKMIGSGPYCFIEAKNDTSMSLFTKLGFTKSFEVVWAAVKFL